MSPQTVLYYVRDLLRQCSFFFCLMLLPPHNVIKTYNEEISDIDHHLKCRRVPIVSEQGLEQSQS